MRRFGTVAAAALAFVTVGGTSAEAGGKGSFSFGISFVNPAPCCRPAPLYYYRPYPVFVEPAPVYVRPVPVIREVPVVREVPVIREVPVAQPAYTQAAPAVRQAASSYPDQSREVDQLLGTLSHPNEQARVDAVTDLGRRKALRAVDPLAATLAGDGSPAVREAAARALGLIGSPNALPALQRAAQADGDRDVRNSARFASEIIMSNR